MNEVGVLIGKIVREHFIDSRNHKFFVRVLGVIVLHEDHSCDLAFRNRVC